MWLIKVWALTKILAVGVVAVAIFMEGDSVALLDAAYVAAILLWGMALVTVILFWDDDDLGIAFLVLSILFLSPILFALFVEINEEGFILLLLGGLIIFPWALWTGVRDLFRRAS